MLGVLTAVLVIASADLADRITYVGHATVLLELGGVRLITDPLLRGRFIHVPRHAGLPDPAVAEQIDAVLISHLHADHLDPPSLRMIGREVDADRSRRGGDACFAAADSTR